MIKTTSYQNHYMIVISSISYDGPPHTPSHSNLTVRPFTPYTHPQTHPRGQPLPRPWSVYSLRNVATQVQHSSFPSNIFCFRNKLKKLRHAKPELLVQLRPCQALAPLFIPIGEFMGEKELGDRARVPSPRCSRRTLTGILKRPHGLFLAFACYSSYLVNQIFSTCVANIIHVLAFSAGEFIHLDQLSHLSHSPIARSRLAFKHGRKDIID